MTTEKGMERKFALVVLAAGIGSRFGGVKQLKPVGPAGEIIMDYSVFDALEAGFNKIVFIIRRDIEEDFREAIGRRIETICSQQGVEVAYAFQERDDLPDGFTCPAERTKPWGTGQALLACKGIVDCPFVVLNADDYYGKNVFASLLAWLKALPVDSKGRYCMAGFRLGNTLSCQGGVTRGVCHVDGRGYLTQVTETRNIQRTRQGVQANGQPLDERSWVSMNMWGFTPDVMDAIAERFADFLREKGGDLKSEFLLPEIVDDLLRQKLATVQVLPTEDQWLGMTYQEDVPLVTAAFREMTQQGLYRPGLYE